MEKGKFIEIYEFSNNDKVIVVKNVQTGKFDNIVLTHEEFAELKKTLTEYKT